MMKLTCILIALAIAGTYGEAPEKIVNGISTTIEENPHTASMRMNGKHMCGGSIISNQYILTAAHCVVPFLLSPMMTKGLSVVTGTKYISTGGESHGIARMIIHENYDRYASGRAAGYDIALIKLLKPISFNERQRAIALPTSDVQQAEAVTTVAWGSKGFKQPVHDDLQKLHAQVMLPETCQKHHQDFMDIHKLEFCTLISRGTGTCNGNSGSGVIRDSDGTICGLVSGGRPCAEGYPDVLTKVFPYVQWIKSNML